MKNVSLGSLLCFGMSAALFVGCSPAQRDQRDLVPPSARGYAVPKPAGAPYGFAYVTYAGYHHSLLAFSIESNGALKWVGSYGTGQGPIGVAIDPTGNYVYVANNGSANLSAYSVNTTTGKLTKVTGSPFAMPNKSIYPEYVAIDPTGGYLYVTARGIFAYAIDAASGALTLVPGSPFGSAEYLGVAVNPLGNYVYAVSPVGSGSNGQYGQLWSFAINANTGALTPSEWGSTSGGGSIGVAVDPTGTFALVTNSESNTVTSFAVAPNHSYVLENDIVAAGTYPSGVAVDPAAKFVYAGNSESENVSAYSIWPSPSTPLGNVSGSPFGTGGYFPIGMAIDPRGKFLYLSAEGGIIAYDIQGTSGALTMIPGSPFGPPDTPLEAIATCRVVGSSCVPPPF